MTITSHQKLVCAVVAGLLALSCIFAPYEYRVHDEVARLVNQSRAIDPIVGITYAPIWSPPARGDGLVGPAWARTAAGAGAAVDDVRFSAGRLFLEWLLVLVTGAACFAMLGRATDAPAEMSPNARRTFR